MAISNYDLDHTNVFFDDEDDLTVKERLLWIANVALGSMHLLYVVAKISSN